jgi:hypothetical protein
MRTFTISDEQEKQFMDWKAEHQKTCPAKPDFSMALYSIVFTPSGLGDSVAVKCPCGDKIYLDAGEEF